MRDITQTHLEAALIDQIVAGTFDGKSYAFIEVTCEDGWQLGVAVHNEPGYAPVNKKFAHRHEAKEWADSLNHHIGLTAFDAITIVCSTMGGTRRHF